MFRFSAFTILALMGFAVASFVTSSGARAEAGDEIICKQRSDIVAGLASQYSEAPVSMGFTEQGTVLEILAAPDGNWTMIETLPSGKACLVASGEMWSGNTPQPMPSNTSY